MITRSPSSGVALTVDAEVRVQRGTAERCACGGDLVLTPAGGLDALWRCEDCGREYA
jgi:hypothetical protein